MSSHKLTKSHSENLSNNQIQVNGVSHKRNLVKQEEIDLTPESNNHLDKDRFPIKTAHSISICINTFEENSSKDNMRQELLNDQASEINSLGNGLKEININEENDEDDSGQSTDATLLPISDQCDSKDKKRTKHLVRCEAVRESSLSPPPPSSVDCGNQVNSNKISLNTNHLTVYSNNKNVTMIKNSSLKSSSNSNSAASSPSLSRDSSTENNIEYSTAELLSFLTESLKKNQKDRMFIFRIEQEIIQLIKDSTKESHKFTASSSYNRMLIHRVAAYFGLEHQVDHTHGPTSVVVTKTASTHIPDLKLKELIKDDESTDEPKKLILKRDSTSFEDSSGSSFDKDRSPESHLNGSLSDSSRSRSLEEREENYERVRARIFNNSSSNEEQPKAQQQPEPTLQPKLSISPNSNVPALVKEVEQKPETSSKEDGATVSKTVSSLENESHESTDCDKGKDAPLLTKSTSTPNTNAASKISNSSNNTQSHDVKKSANAHNRFDGNNQCNNYRGKYGNQRNGSGGGGGGRVYSEPQQPPNFNRYSQNRKSGEIGKDAAWSLKPNLNQKLASQHMPYSLLYNPNCLDGSQFVARGFPPTLNPHASMAAAAANQFQLGTHPYLPTPLLPNEQTPMPSNYPFMYSNLQSLCGPNGVPYSPPHGNLPQAPNFNSLMGMQPAYHHPHQQYQQAAALPLNSLMGNMPPNFKQPHMNDFPDNGQLKNGNFAKGPAMPPPHLNYHMASGQFPCPEVLDHNLGQVQFNASSHLPQADLMMNSRAAAALHHPASFALNYANKRHPNDVMISNPTQLLQTPQAMYHFNQAQKSFYANSGAPRQNGKYSNNRSGSHRRGGGSGSAGGGHPPPNPSRKY